MKVKFLNFKLYVWIQIRNCNLWYGCIWSQYDPGTNAVSDNSIRLPRRAIMHYSMVD